MLQLAVRFKPNSTYRVRNLSLRRRLICGIVFVASDSPAGAVVRTICCAFRGWLCAPLRSHSVQTDCTAAVRRLARLFHSICTASGLDHMSRICIPLLLDICAQRQTLSLYRLLIIEVVSTTPRRFCLSLSEWESVSLMNRFGQWEFENIA